MRRLISTSVLPIGTAHPPLGRHRHRLGDLPPADVATRPAAQRIGAFVITGEALKKENAEAISRLNAGWSGRFICVSAGPNHEAMLAALGSGRLALSQKLHGTVVNVDIGGGTTKVSVLVDGRVTHLESFSVGARLLAFDGTARSSGGGM